MTDDRLEDADIIEEVAEIKKTRTGETSTAYRYKYLNEKWLPPMLAPKTMAVQTFNGPHRCLDDFLRSRNKLCSQTISRCYF